MHKLLAKIRKYQEKRRIAKWIEKRHEDYDREIEGLKKKGI